MVVEQEKCLVLCHSKDEKSEWDMISYAKPEEIISLRLLNILLPVKDIYQK